MSGMLALLCGARINTCSHPAICLLPGCCKMHRVLLLGGRLTFNGMINGNAKDAAVPQLGQPNLEHRLLALQHAQGAPAQQTKIQKCTEASITLPCRSRWHRTNQYASN